MASTIKIGSVQIKDEDYAIQANAVLGIRGTGKTTLAKSIAEQLLELHVPIVVFDPTGVWRYLKQGAKPGQKGFNVVVAGGVEPDLTLTPATAVDIIRAAIRENISIVIDLYDPKFSKGDWKRIVRDCFRTLMYENKGVRHIFLEEAAEFVPQRILDADVYAEVEKVARMGGNASLGLTLINQRSQEVAKAVLELCENLFLMKQRGAHAIDAIEKWVDKLDPRTANEVTGNLSNLLPGEVFVLRGSDDRAHRTHGNKLRSFHPDRRRPGEGARHIKTGAIVDVKKFVSRLSEQLKNKEAALPANVDELKKRIRQLESAALHKEATLSPHFAAKEQIRERDAEIKQLKKKMRVLISKLAHIYKTASVGSDFEIQLENGSTTIGTDPKPLGKQDFSASVFERHAEDHKKLNNSYKNLVDNANTGLTAPQAALLRSLYWLRNEERTLHKIAFYAGYKPGRYSSDRIGELRTKGLVARGSFDITEEGAELIAQTAGEKPEGERLREVVRGLLTGPQNAIIDALIAQPTGLTLEHIAEDTKYEKGRYLTDRLGELRQLRLIFGKNNETMTVTDYLR